MNDTTAAFVLTPYSIGYAVSLFITVSVIAVAWRKRHTGQGLALTLLMTAASIWTLFGLLEVSATAQETKILLSKLEYIGGLSTPVFFLIFAAAYAGAKRWLTLRCITLLFIIPVFTLVLAATNEYHQLIWTSFSPGQAGSNLIIYHHGPWFWFSNIGYSTFCLLGGSLLILRQTLQTHREFRVRAVLMLSGVAIPWLGGLIYVSGLNPLPGYDLTRVAFGFSGIFFLLAIFGRRLLDITPIARNIVIDMIPDGMLVLDENNRIIDINRSAEKLTGISGERHLGQSIHSLTALAPWLDQLESFNATPVELKGFPDGERYLEATVTDLKTAGDKGNFGKIVFLRDITDRKKAEDATRQAADQWTTTFDSIKDPIAIIDPKHRIVRVNQSFSQLVSQPDTEIIGRHCFEVIHGTDEPFPECPHVHTIENCVQSTAEFLEPGLKRFIEVSTSPIISAEGTCAGSVHVIKDITERKQAEIALKENESRLRLLFNNMTEGVALHRLITDDEGKPVDYQIVDVNPMFESILGIKKESVIGRLATEVYGTNEAPYIREYARVATTGHPENLDVYFSPMGKYFDISITPWGDKGFATIFTDITESKQIWETKSHLAAIVEFSSDALIGRDLNGIITSWNQAAEKMLGYTAAEMIGQTNSPLIPPDMANETPEIIKGILETGTASHWETVRRRKDGKLIDVSVTISPIKDTQGSITGFSTIARDITEANRSRDNLKRALREKELLLKEIHHRVKNNMQVISSLLKMQSKFVEDEPTKLMLKESQERIKSMSLVYNKLYQSSDLAMINIKDYVNELVNNLIHAYAISPGAISAEIDAADITLDLDTAIPLGLIINELVTNSMKYAFPAGRRGIIRVGLAAGDKTAEYRLTVKDDGIGLPDNFDPQNNRSLGMRLVNALARHQLGGTLEHLQNKGTEFIITFRKG